VEIRALTNSAIGEVLRSDKLVLVDFWAGWCGRYTRFAPVLEAFAAAHGEKVDVRTVNADHEAGLVTTYGISSLPTLLLFSGGRVAATVRNPATLSDLEEQLADHL